MMDIKVVVNQAILIKNNEKDGYGNSIYTAYNERYAYQNPTGRDGYGNPTYN